MTYDPRSLGALCDQCPLNQCEPVGPEGPTIMEMIARAGEVVAIVGEAPGEHEEKQGRPFVGPSGNELSRSLKMAGFHRGDMHVTNVIKCRPPGNDLKGLLAKISRRNKEHEKKWREEVKEAEKNGDFPPLFPRQEKTPLECCKPLFEQEVDQFTKFIALGKTANEALTGIHTGILAVRGGMVELEPTMTTLKRQVMPTVHPAFVLRAQRWAHVFRSDIAKAGRWFRGMTEWVEPKRIFQPTVGQLQEFLTKHDLYAYDVETDDIECLTAKIRCIAIGTTDEVICVSLLGIDGYTKFYSPIEEMAILEVMREFFTNPDIMKVSHNGGYYDRLVIEHQWGFTPGPNIDTMLLHRSTESELPHSLAYVGSMYTEAPAWKTDREGNKLATGGESDEQLAEYCQNDVVVTARVMPKLVDKVRLNDQVEIFHMDQRMQAICADMHAVGMYVDQEKRLAEERKLLARRHELLTNIRDAVGRLDFNPGSVFQVSDVLFTEWGLRAPLDEEELYTASGNLSTGDLVLRSLLTTPDVPEERREVIKAIRYYRKCQKILGTYVCKLRPNDMDADVGWDEDEDWVDRETREKYGEVKKGIVNPATGRMYPGYNAHVAVTGRLSSSKPINAQNFPKVLRAMVVAQPGHILVGADMDQLELRIAAALWGVELYLKAFESGKDPHSMTAFAVFGDAFCTAAGITSDQFGRPGPLVGACYTDGVFNGSNVDALKMRNLSKAVQYASQYMAAVETVHKLICKTEVPAKDPKTGQAYNDGTTDLPYARMALRRVRKMRDNWLRGAKEFERGWHMEIAEFRRYGHLREPVTGRRRDFLDGEDPNQIVNFKVQGGAAGLMNKAIIQLHEAIPRNKWGPGTGIINQCHDSIVIECPIDGAYQEKDSKGKLVWKTTKGSIPYEVAGLLEECLNQTHPNLPGVKFTATAGLGLTWKEVG